MKIKMTVTFDVDPDKYADIYHLSTTAAEGEIPGYLAAMLQEGVDSARKVGDRRYWVLPIDIAQEV